ncbi:MAG: hypothetical protein ACMUIA_04000 [bacterium]
MIGERDKRLASILGMKISEDSNLDEVFKVTRETLEKYLKYLKQNIEYPCYLTGSDEQAWVKFYTFIAGNKKQYEALKNTFPSHTDVFSLVKFKEQFIPEMGIFIHVQRISDKEEFTLPLHNVKAFERESKNTQLLDDHRVWFMSNRRKSARVLIVHAGSEMEEK